MCFPRMWCQLIGRRLRKNFFLLLGFSVLVITALTFVYSANPHKLFYPLGTSEAAPTVSARPRPVPHWVVLCLDSDVTPLDWRALPPDWRAVVLAKERPRDCRAPGCLYLSEVPEFKLQADQCHLSIAAKMAAYLYAMKNGATTVLIGQPDIPVPDWLQGFHMTSSMSGLVFTGSPIFDPEVHFGLWRKALNKSLEYNVVDVAYPFIQHRLPWPNSTDASPQDVAFLSFVMIGKETYSPFAISDTLLLYEGFWALPFLCLYAGAQSDVGEGTHEAKQLEAEYSASLVVQRLMQELDAHVAFVAPTQAFVEASSQSEAAILQQFPVETTSQHNQSLDRLDEYHAKRSRGKRAAKQKKRGEKKLQGALKRNETDSDSPDKPRLPQPHPGQDASTPNLRGLILQSLSTSAKSRNKTVPTSDLEQVIEPKLANGSVRILKLFNFLRRWRCASFDSFLSCVDQLLTNITGRFISLETASGIHQALRQMADIGYIFPLRFVPENINYQPLTSVSYVPPSAQESWRRLEPMRSVCPSLPDLPSSPSAISDIMLIVTFNYPELYRNIEYVKSLYRPYFRHMMFCGPNTTILQQHVQQDVQDGDGHLYAEGLKRKWFFMYECTLFAMAMNPHVRGYLQIGDDTLVNPWQLASLPRDKVWLPAERKEQNIESTKDFGWMWWNSGLGRTVLQKVFHELTSLVQEPQAVRSYSLARDIRNTFYTNAKSMTKVYYRGTDFFYIPERVREKYIFLSKLYLKHGVMNELALINLVLGLDLMEDIHFFSPDGSLWYGGERSWYEKFYNSSLLFMHPFKASQLKTDKGKKFFCDNYMSHFMKHLRTPS